MNDAMNAIGVVRVTKRDKRTGVITFDTVFKNQITNYARISVANLWTGASVAVPSMIAVGTGAPTPPATSTSPSDSALWTELTGTRKTVDYATTFLQYYTQYSVTYQQTEAIGTVTTGNPTGSIALTEAGLFDANGNLWSHVSLTGVTHDNTTTLSIQWQVLQNGN